jgi:hypothetical protein
MASNATNPRPGRVVRVIHWLFPSRREVAIGLVVDLGLTALGLPLWLHVAVSVAVHAAVHVVGRHPGSGKRAIKGANEP